MSSSRRRDGSEINSKLHMDRQPTVTRITDPSLPAGKRREIDNVMKKARASTNEYWDKKLLEVEEKDPNRWRHSGYKKMYIEGETSSGESESYRYGSSAGGPPPLLRCGRSRSTRSRSISRIRKSPPLSPSMHCRSPIPVSHDIMNNMSRSNRISYEGSSRAGRPRTPDRGAPRSPSDMGSRRSLNAGGRPRSPESSLRRKSRSPVGGHRAFPDVNMTVRRRSQLPSNMYSTNTKQRGQAILPRSKRPPSPPPRSTCRSRSNSSVSSCSNDTCSVCSPTRHTPRSTSMPRSRENPHHSSSRKSRNMQYVRCGTVSSAQNRGLSPSRKGPIDKYRGNAKIRRVSRDCSVRRCNSNEIHTTVPRSNRDSPPEDPRLKNRPPETSEAASSSSSLIRTRIKIEGEKRKKQTTSESEESVGTDSDEPLPTFTATTRLTLSERFGKMAQWSIDRSNMENMRITKDSAGGALKVMIEEGLNSPPRHYTYSPAPAGHFPEELATTAPSGMLSWDDVRVRYEYYKSRGYLRDLDLKDYIKWEEWWYKYQEWLKHERYYDYWERQQMLRRRRKKLPITQRLN